MIGLPNHDETTLIFFSRNPKDNAHCTSYATLKRFPEKK